MIDLDAYKNLANAVVMNAVDEYKKAYKAFIKEPDDKETLSEIRSLERFFHSQWFHFLTSIDGDKLLSYIRYNVRNKTDKRIPRNNKKL